MKAVNLALLVLVATMSAGLAQQQANATGVIYIAGNAASDCKGASGYSGQAFYFAPQYVENTTTAGQYLNCSYPLVRDMSQAYTADGSTGYSASIGLRNTAASASQFTCVGVVGYDGQSSSLVTYSSKNATVASATMGSISYGAADLPLRSADQFLSFSCLVPGGGQMRYIDVYQPKNF